MGFSLLTLALFRVNAFSGGYESSGTDSIVRREPCHWILPFWSGSFIRTKPTQVAKIPTFSASAL
jgi:hypothetical protein